MSTQSRVRPLCFLPAFATSSTRSIIASRSNRPGCRGSILERAHFKLAARFAFRNIETCFRQSPQTLGTQVLVNDADGPVATVQPFLHEGQHDLLFVAAAGEKGAHVTTTVPFFTSRGDEEKVMLPFM